MREKTCGSCGNFKIIPARRICGLSDKGDKQQNRDLKLLKPVLLVILCP